MPEFHALALYKGVKDGHETEEVRQSILSAQFESVRVKQKYLGTP